MRRSLGILAKVLDYDVQGGQFVRIAFAAIFGAEPLKRVNIAIFGGSIFCLFHVAGNKILDYVYSFHVYMFLVCYFVPDESRELSEVVSLSLEGGLVVNNTRLLLQI